MEIANYQPQNEAVRKYFKRIAEQRAEAAAVLAVLEEEREKGREEGRAPTLAMALLTVLDARSIALTEEHRAKIAGCTDADVLVRWLTDAATRGSADEILVG